jgi:large subunit ribosomal protein L29
MNADEIRKMTDDELRAEQERLRREVFDLRCQMVTEKLENPREIRASRRDLARVLTQERARQNQEATEA